MQRQRPDVFIGFATGSKLRVMDARPLTVTLEQVQGMLPELRTKTAQGILQLKSLDGRPIDLDTLLPTRPLVTASKPQLVDPQKTLVLPRGAVVPRYPTAKLPLATPIEHQYKGGQPDQLRDIYGGPLPNYGANKEAAQPATSTNDSLETLSEEELERLTNPLITSGTAVLPGTLKDIEPPGDLNV
jgi:hypothetical protein